MLREILDTVDAEKKAVRETLRDEIAASLACHAAIKEHAGSRKMRWLIDRLLLILHRPLVHTGGP